MGLKTALYETHVARGAKIVDFGGWDMPLHYGSQIEEHHAVRRDAGMFDVSHMGIIDLSGVRAQEFLRHLLANDVAKLKASGNALYSCLLRDDGGVVDDAIVYAVGSGYRMVVNAGSRDKDLAWIGGRAALFDVRAVLRSDLAMIAVQGPNARPKTARLLPQAARVAALELLPFSSATVDSWFIARTGYTGEDGFEIALPAVDAAKTWEALRAQGIALAGLGARDTLRLEAGMKLYGSDLDETHNPLESGVARTVAFDPAERDFIGRQALERLRASPGNELVGLLLEEPGVLRSRQDVFTELGTGQITSGTFSPTLNRSIGLARIPVGAGPRVQVEIRGKRLAARVVKPPFVRNGKARISVESLGPA